MLVVKAFLVLMGVYLTHGSDESRGTFTFPEFDYKESYKNELSYKEFESACKQSAPCIELDTGSLERLKCVRKCISPSCYAEIYRINDLEEGEIDVRLQSFKGCFIQRFNRSRA